MILRQALADGAARLRQAGVDSPEVDARLLAAHLAGTGPLGLDLRGGVPEGFWDLLARRAAREPLQHIIGTAAFGHLDLDVGPGVFIPRPETEVLADWAVKKLSLIDAASPVVVDLCTGSGAIAEYVASLVPAARVTGVEKRAPALDFARRNAPHADIVQGDVTEAILPELAGAVDLVLSNPPYVPEDGGLQAEVYADPPEAVFAGPDGMDVIVKMTPLIYRLLKPGGWLGIEHDDSTSGKVQSVLRAAGFADVSPMSDLGGRARFVTARKVAE